MCVLKVSPLGLAMWKTAPSQARCTQRVASMESGREGAAQKADSSHQEESFFLALLLLFFWNAESWGFLVKSWAEG